MLMNQHTLSKEEQEEKEAIKKHAENNKDEAGTTNLGALLKAKLTNKKDV